MSAIALVNIRGVGGDFGHIDVRVLVSLPWFHQVRQTPRDNFEGVGAICGQVFTVDLDPAHETWCNQSPLQKMVSVQKNTKLEYSRSISLMANFWLLRQFSESLAESSLEDIKALH